MISHLTIKNFALIEDLEISFEKGLTTITGETGAGKSIILTAVSLLAGNRADLSMVRNPDKKCIIEAEFNLKGQNLELYFADNDIDYSDHTIIRREFGKEGKSRVFINDSPAVLLHLKSIVNKLLDVHSQHENLELNKRQYQLESVDRFGDLLSDRKFFTETYQNYRKAEKEFIELEKESAQLRENADYVSFQLNELVDADIKTGEWEELENELDTMSHLEEIKSNLHRIQEILNKEENGIGEELSTVLGLIRKTSSHLPGIKELGPRTEALVIELEDIQSELNRYSEGTDLDPNRMAEVQERMSVLHQLQQKHRLPDTEGLIVLREKLSQDFEQISNLDHYVDEARNRRDSLLTEMKSSAENLSEKRKIVAKDLSVEISSLLKRLGMSSTRFEIQVTNSEEFSATGQDSIEFMFSANEGMPLKPVSKVASGGEMSRLMLSVKAALSKRSPLSSIIFDEIDSGISGQVADKMGKIIQEMGQATQIIAITHLPQIAAKGIRQLKVFKEGEEGQTRTRIKILEKSERVNEIARLLSGETISDQAVENARVLLGAND